MLEQHTERRESSYEYWYDYAGRLLKAANLHFGPDLPDEASRKKFYEQLFRYDASGRMRYHSHKGCYLYGSAAGGGTPFHAPSYVLADFGYDIGKTPGAGCKKLAADPYPVHKFEYDPQHNQIVIVPLPVIDWREASFANVSIGSGFAAGNMVSTGEDTILTTGGALARVASGRMASYDTENRPYRVEFMGQTTQYVYGADGSRLLKIEPSILVRLKQKRCLSICFTDLKHAFELISKPKLL